MPVRLGVLAWAKRRGSTARRALRRRTGAGATSLPRCRGLALAQRARPDDPGIAYDLGLCGNGLGNADAAVRAWELSPAARRWGRWRPSAWPIPKSAAVGWPGPRWPFERWTAARSGPEAAHVVETLLGLVRLEMRSAEIRPLVEKLWTLTARAGTGALAKGLTPPRELLRLHAMIDLDPSPTTSYRELLLKAEAQAPEDDRVWLGLANVALREGDLAEADRRLQRCEAARRNDPAVLRARLDWARTSGDLERTLAVLQAMPAEGLDPVALFDVQAWLARERGDTAAEREALRSRLEWESSHAAALGRLAELSSLSGDREEARALRARKSDVDEKLAVYRETYYDADPATRGPEMAAQAEALGRRFEARAWWELYASAHPGDRNALDQLAKLLQTTKPPSPPSLAEVLATSTPSQSPRTTADERGAPHFEDHAEPAGLKFTHHNGETPQRQLPETMSGGVALVDVDGDGRLDVYCVQGGPLVPDPALKRDDQGDRLFRNRGDGTFEDVTARAGLAGSVHGYGNGVTVGDVDGDGHPDLFLTRLDTYQLLRNRGDGTFEDVTERWGLSGPRDWPTSAAFADLDGDGDQDLYVAHYGAWDVRNPLLCQNAAGQPSYCRPRAIPATADRLFRNDGGRFVDVTREAGIVDTNGRGLGVLAADLDGDRRVDLFVANDTTANYLWRNLGGMKFEEVGEVSGVAANGSGGFQAGMGIALGDVDGDGRLDLAVTNFFGESTTLFQNLGGGMFADQTAASGLLVATRTLLGFGTVFLDADNDGMLDLLTVNGHVTDNRPEFPFQMPAQILQGRVRGRFVDVSARAGSVFSVPRLGRGLAAGDLDDDGRVDAVAIDQNRPLVYFHNDSRAGGWVRFVLEGVASNRDAVGAVVTVESGGRKRVAQRFGGGSYQSASDPRIHFGLGAAASVDRVEVTWPSGRVDRYENLNVNRQYRLREGSPRPLP
ncbi:MAG: FG-GAP-like repeat-containing protein [Isosphaeraceae bacterium]